MVYPKFITKESENFFRHQILSDFFDLVSDEDYKLKSAVEASTLINYKKVNITERTKAVGYLLAGGYLKHFLADVEIKGWMNALLITQSGMDALKAEYFIEKEKEDVRTRKKIFISEVSTVAVIAGILYSILWPTSPELKSKIEIQVEQPKNLYIDTVLSVTSKTDSAIRIRMVLKDSSD